MNQAGTHRAKIEGRGRKALPFSFQASAGLAPVQHEKGRAGGLPTLPTHWSGRRLTPDHAYLVIVADVSGEPIKLAKAGACVELIEVRAYGRLLQYLAKLDHRNASSMIVGKA